MKSKLLKKIPAIILTIALMITRVPATMVNAAEFTTTPMISARNRQTVVLKKDGSIWWLGLAPLQEQNINNVTAIATGGHYMIGLKSDGTVWAWGANHHGQLGDGTYTDRDIPVKVPNLSNVIAISAGGDGWLGPDTVAHTVALKSDGTVWAWGSNTGGQLGNGTTKGSNIPVQVQGLNDVIAISTGTYHTVALKQDGTVCTWGANFFGQLGDETYDNRNTPVQVPSLSDVTAISARESGTVALKSDGTVWRWGTYWEFDHPSGYVTGSSRDTPEQVPNLSDVTAISGGAQNTVALKSDGTVWAWGSNECGQFGNGTTTQGSNTPVQVQKINNVTAISTSGEHTVVLKADGTVWAWGNNYNGQLGDGTTVDRSIPIQARYQDGAGYFNVFENAPPPTATAIAISGAPTKYVWKAAGGNKPIQLMVAATPANAAIKDVSWSVNNTKIATINATSGLLKFTGAEGIVRVITVSKSHAKTISTFTDIKVVKHVTKIDTPRKRVYVQSGKTYTIPIAIYDEKAEVKAKLTWASSNSKIKVSQTGKVKIPKSLKNGSSTITVMAENGKRITVTALVSPNIVKLNKTTITMPKIKVGQIKKLSVKPSPAKATLTKITFKSNKPRGLYIDKAGNLIAKKKGTYIITITVNNKSVNKKIKVE